MSPETERELDLEEERDCWTRCCSVPGAGSIRGGVFNLASATLGAGALALPAAFSTTGIPLGLLLLVSMAVITAYSISLLIEVADKVKLYSYEEISVYCFGRKFGFVVEINIILFCFGAAVGYIIAASQIVTPLIYQSICGADTKHCKSDFLPHWIVADGVDSDGWLYRLVCCVFTVTVMFPLSLIDKMNSLRFTSIAGVGSICYLIFAISGDSLAHAADYDYGEAIGTDISVGGVLLAVPTIMFAFTCQVNVFAIYQELHRPSPARINKVGQRSCMLSCVLYAMICIFGFLRFTDLKYDWNSSHGNILNNYELQPASQEPDCTEPSCWSHSSFNQLLHAPAILVGEAAITITILLAFPLNIFPCRYTLEMMLLHSEPLADANKASFLEADLLGDEEKEINSQLLDSDDPTDPGLKALAEPSRDVKGCLQHFVLTASIVAPAMALAMFLPNIQVVFSLLGSTTSAFVCYIVPAMFVLKVEDGPLCSRKKIPAVLLLVGGSITGMVCTVVIVYTTFIDK